MKQKYIEKRITGECVKENDLKKIYFRALTAQKYTLKIRL